MGRKYGSREAYKAARKAMSEEERKREEARRDREERARMIEQMEPVVWALFATGLMAGGAGKVPQLADKMIESWKERYGPK